MATVGLERDLADPGSCGFYEYVPEVHFYKKLSMYTERNVIATFYAVNHIFGCLQY